MLLIRRFEEKIAEIYSSDVIKSPVHLSIGQEAVAVGVCDVLADDDIVSNTYRCHATHIAKGGDLNKMMAELYGKKDGCAGGKAGSMHLIELEKGIMGASAVVGTTVPVAVGYAMALKFAAQKTGKQRVVVAFFGDGATEEGSFSESINFAALHKLPIIFLCENNKLAIHSPIERRWPTDKICERIATYGIKTHRIIDGDIFKIREIAKEATSEVRSGAGPVFIECFTYRYKEHVGPAEDLNEEYRNLDEYKKWSANDQILKLGALISKKEQAEITQIVEKEIATSIKFAEKSEFPGKKELLENIYAPRLTPALSLPNHHEKNQKLIRYVDAIAQGCEQEMKRDDKVFVFGLDVDDHKKIQGSTAGLEKFGAQRLFGTPLSEDAMTGVAVGAAMYGYRPIHVHIRMDFMTLAANQLINMAAKAHYMYNGALSVPMVVRAMIGRSWGQGAQHSQALHAIFAHIPGLRVVAPSNAYDAKGCMIAAIRDNNPVVFMEHRLLCNMESYVPQESYELEIGKGRVVKEGSDVTIVAISHMNIEAVRAAKYLETIGIKAEIIDPIWINPFDIELIKKSVAKTGKLLIVDNGWVEFGVSAEISSRVLEEFQKDKMSVPKIARMGFAQTTCPTTKSLEDLFYPNPKTIADKICEMLAKNKIDWTKISFENKELAEFK
ncbi:MAG TPA: thiamine pyrophosphate-dependent enzyme, partial [Rickettsiales bacterium]|nr:thiamine pyrophosphate-dependent enzyme [Rickettsiales bacterium]